MAELPISPLAPDRPADAPPVPGVEIAVAATGERYRRRPDLLCVRLPEDATAAALFTRSSMPGAPVVVSRRHLAASDGAIRGLVINAGRANAFTGAGGERDAEVMAQRYATAISARPEQILIASTGVIGEPLNMAALGPALDAPAFGRGSWPEAARAIGTTDTFPKLASTRTEIDGAAVTITGIAKGSGMIRPDMATMIAAVFTDAAIPAEVLQNLLAEANAVSFDCISVDGDCSTSDSLILMASGVAGHAPVTGADDPRLGAFRRALADVLIDLATQVVRDGEGAQKFVTITVTGATDDAAAKRAGMAVANSPLVRTAIAGSDPNWGRLVMAVGNAGVAATPERLEIRLGGQPVTCDGARHPAYSEEEAAAHMAGREIDIAIDLGMGAGRARIWTCDLTHGYISINADYRS